MVHVNTSAQVSSEDIAALRAQGLTVDDDNEAVPENIPSPTDSTITNRIGVEWKWENTTICPRKARGVPDVESKFANASWDVMANMSNFQLYQLCFPIEYLTNILIPIRLCDKDNVDPRYSCSCPHCNY